MTRYWTIISTLLTLSNSKLRFRIRNYAFDPKLRFRIRNYAFESEITLSNPKLRFRKITYVRVVYVRQIHIFVVQGESGEIRGWKVEIPVTSVYQPQYQQVPRGIAEEHFTCCKQVKNPLNIQLGKFIELDFEYNNNYTITRVFVSRGMHLEKPKETRVVVIVNIICHDI